MIETFHHSRPIPKFNFTLNTNNIRNVVLYEVSGINIPIVAIQLNTNGYGSEQLLYPIESLKEVDSIDWPDQCMKDLVIFYITANYGEDDQEVRKNICLFVYPLVPEGASDVAPSGEA